MIDFVANDEREDDNLPQFAIGGGHGDDDDGTVGKIGNTDEGGDREEFGIVEKSEDTPPDESDTPSENNK